MNIADPALSPFVIALALMAILAVIELGSLIFGASASGLVDSLLPDHGADFDGHAHAGDGASGFLAWLGVGRVPMLVLVALLLACFAIIGLSIQAAVHAVLGSYLPAFVAAAIAAPLSLFPTHWIGRVVARFFPREESDAVSRDSFIGRVAVVLRGEAAQGYPAEAKLRDGLSAVHYILVEPDVEGQRFAAGSEVLLVAKDGAVFRVIANPSASLKVGSLAG